MANYATEQKKMLSDFLKEHDDRAFSIDELIEGLRTSYGSHAPGNSTVYRLILRLVEEGSVKRFVKGHSRHFVYQSVRDEHCHSHLHLKCTACGRLVHLDEQVSDSLLHVIQSNSDFAVDEEETVLFGACASCRDNKKRGDGSL